ncbi:SMI1/KNR4 family protein [Psychrobacter phenylpyruvicus]|uniref:SMI1 / KNR4 family n=1 Tax=Psychrobacter phenylpyruvicus TaxID=29432 RepID=A0A379LJ85_9GAMM|nr:SMI1/KNR4 family protein [Psychrobacter phenylpyruvicus]SUD90608.1 SMI1 / KNR4 family [Psychrobacter phenylpyruvicus]
MNISVYKDNGSNDVNNISMIENQLNYSLPQLYKDIVKKHDALRPEKDIFDFINIYGKPDDRDVNFYSLKKNHIDGFIIEEQANINDIDNGGIKGLVTFAFTANGDYICFDYREDHNSDNPKVVLVYHDDIVENEDGTSSMAVNFLADSFEEFMNMLHD